MSRQLYWSKRDWLCADNRVRIFVNSCWSWSVVFLWIAVGILLEAVVLISQLLMMEGK